MTRNLQSRLTSGVTLIELLVVLTIVGVLAAVVAPSVGSGLDTVKLRSTAERMAATFRVAHERAVRSHHYMQVTIDPGSRLVELRDLEGGSTAGWDIPAAIVVRAEKPAAFLLYPDGGAQLMHVTLENARGRQLEIVMDSFTMFPSVREVSQ